MTESFDVLIVGGGSAGAVLANRLTADHRRRVLLLEAGSAYAPNLYPADLANADIVGGPDGHDWGYVGTMGTGGRTLNAPRGKVLGGSSAVNAGVAIRARAADFAKWSAIGIRGWSFAEVLASYKVGLEGSGAVVDSFGRVYGMRGLMVVDASIMPFVPSAPTNLTTIMIAEHVARHWGGSSSEDA